MQVSGRILRGCLFAVGIAVALVVAGVVSLLIVSWRRPEDSPLARMYRTEADLAALAKAVAMYAEAHSVYPPPGQVGLRLATDYVSRDTAYFPDGPPPDGWERPYRYVPSSEYAAKNSGACRVEGEFAAPGAFQLYSLGADGVAGLDDAAQQADNITSWDPSKAWRAIYHEQEVAFRRKRR